MQIRGALAITSRVIEIFFKVLRLQPENLVPGMEKLVLLMWACLVLISAWTALREPIELKFRLIWIALIVFVPFLGLLGFCVYRFSKLDFSFLGSLVATKEMQKRKGTSRAAAKAK